METPRYLDLVTELQRWSVDPPLRPGSTPEKLREKAYEAAAKADSRLKAAKRARYAGELIAWYGSTKSAKRKVKRYKRIQTVLGDLQDTAVAREALRQLGAAAGTTPGENGFTFGLLFAREQQLAQQRRLVVAKR